jgi:hypothetical protein
MWKKKKYLTTYKQTALATSKLLARRSAISFYSPQQGKMVEYVVIRLCSPYRCDVRADLVRDLSSVVGSLPAS